ncbi:MAG: hypothetical protein L0H32_12815, partial [Micrococcaceae bacterium]|nr:hypothetical protein [Micrococcaceae bacterium]
PPVDVPDPSSGSPVDPWEKVFRSSLMTWCPFWEFLDSNYDNVRCVLEKLYLSETCENTDGFP